MYVNVSNFYKTFSGTDALVFLMFPNCKPICLGNVTTITYSFYRNKKTVYVLGKVNANGVAKGPRVVAGTMIMTVMNQNWANELREQIPELAAVGNIKSDDLPVFDIMIVCANEYGSSVSMYVYGVDVTDEGQVLSVEDMFSENTVTFLARDIDVPTAFDVLGGASATKNRRAVLKKNTDNFVINGNTPLNRTLMLTTPAMKGDDVTAIQKLLNMHHLPTTVTGVYDYETYQNVMTFQSLNGLTANGVLDDSTMTILNFLGGPDEADLYVTSVISNMHGANVYALPDLSSKINDRMCYNYSVSSLKTDDDWYKVDTGYVYAKDVFSAYETNTYTFDTILPHDKTDEVKIVQQALNASMEANLVITGVYDEETQNAILAYESMNGLPSTLNITYDIYDKLRSEKTHV